MKFDYYDNNGNLYLTEYKDNNHLDRVDVYYKTENTFKPMIKYSTFFKNGKIREVFGGEGVIKYNPDGTIRKKIYYVNDEISSVYRYENQYVYQEHYHLKNNIF